MAVTEIEEAHLNTKSVLIGFNKVLSVSHELALKQVRAQPRCLASAMNRVSKVFLAHSKELLIEGEFISWLTHVDRWSLSRDCGRSLR